MSGAYSELKELVSLRIQARDLALFRRRRSRSLLAGAGQSPFKGRGIDFEEVRAYQHGDDIRSIDWRVTARRMKPHTKIFREERERPVLVLLDQTHSLFFGSQLNFKSVTAAEICSLLSWSTLLHGDRIGGLVFNEDSLSEIRPKRSKQTLMHLLHKVEEHNRLLSTATMPTSMPGQSNGSYLTRALRHARRVAHPGTNLFVISDFSQMDEEAWRHFARLSRHCEVMAIQVFDPLEANLPRPGLYDITNGMHRKTIDTRGSGLRLKYRNHYEQAVETLKDRFGSHRIPFLRVASDQDTATQLMAHFGSVRSRVKTSGKAGG
ncbi:MAG: DUF58 domain-containing protein [Endozoicomonas sp.]